MVTFMREVLCLTSSLATVRYNFPMAGRLLATGMHRKLLEMGKLSIQRERFITERLMGLRKMVLGTFL
jgi:hypothetical protein